MTQEQVKGMKGRNRRTSGLSGENTGNKSDVGLREHRRETPGTKTQKTQNNQMFQRTRRPDDVADEK